MNNEKEIAIEKLQKALLKLPKDDLVKLLKNTYQVMRNKHNIPQERKNSNQDEKINKIEINNYKSNNKVENSQNNKEVINEISRLGVSGKGKEIKEGKVEQIKSKIFERRIKENKQNRNEIKKQERVERSEQRVLEDGNVTLEKVQLNGEQININYLKNKDLINKYLNFEYDAEELTFRSQNVDIPQLDLKPALDYIKSKHNQKTIGVNSSNNNINKEKELDNTNFNADNQSKGYINKVTLENYRQGGDNQEKQDENEDEVMTPTFSPKNSPKNLQHFDSCSTNTTINEVQSQNHYRGLGAEENVKKTVEGIKISSSMINTNKKSGSTVEVGVLKRVPLTYRINQQSDHQAYNLSRQNTILRTNSYVKQALSPLRRSTSLIHQPTGQLVNTSHNFIKPIANYVNPADSMGRYIGYKQTNNTERQVIGRNNFKAFLC